MVQEIPQACNGVIFINLTIVHESRWPHATMLGEECVNPPTVLADEHS